MLLFCLNNEYIQSPESWPHRFNITWLLLDIVTFLPSIVDVIEVLSVAIHLPDTIYKHDTKLYVKCPRNYRVAQDNCAHKVPALRNRILSHNHLLDICFIIHLKWCVFP